LSSTPYGLYALARRNYIPYERWGAICLNSIFGEMDSKQTQSKPNRYTQSQLAHLSKFSKIVSESNFQGN